MTNKNALGLVQDAVTEYEQEHSCTACINVPVLAECFDQVAYTLQLHFEHPSPGHCYTPTNFKIAGVICFWLRKLKPFSVSCSIKNNTFVNETIALLTAHNFVQRYSLQKSRIITNKDLFLEVVTSLRYNSWSPSSLAFLFQSLCI